MMKTEIKYFIIALTAMMFILGTLFGKWCAIKDARLTSETTDAYTISYFGHEYEYDR